jgi:hypothetical protein
MGLDNSQTTSSACHGNQAEEDQTATDTRASAPAVNSWVDQ